MAKSKITVPPGFIAWEHIESEDDTRDYQGVAYCPYCSHETCPLCVESKRLDSLDEYIWHEEDAGIVPCFGDLSEVAA